jgi:tetratricopeptide (TPR) repeat protein
MKINLSGLFIVLGFLLPYGFIFAQEIETEDSAEVFLEEYSDTFQETFFEALKQKGIENYDKAINLFLECKKIDPSKKVVDFELAKVYSEGKMYDAALEYSVNAVNSEPENYWYVHTLVNILQLKRSDLSEIQNQIPADNVAFKQNLAQAYFQSENYNAATAVLNTLKTSTFTENLNAKLKESLKKQEEIAETIKYSNTITANNSNTDSNTINGFINNIVGLISANNYLILDSVSKDALENFPAQPYFYYARGLALNKKSMFREAVKVLEESLDYMLDDIALANKIYKELSDAYTGLNNPVKASIYLRKIKPGF